MARRKNAWAWLVTAAGVLVLLGWWWHRARRVELARYEGETITAVATYVPASWPYGLVGIGGIWCEVRTEQGRLGRWITGRMECDVPSDWSVEVVKTASGIEIIKWKHDDRDRAETFRFRGITGPHSALPEAGGSG